MQPTTTATYRVLASPRDAAELLLIDVDSHDPTYVATDASEGDLAATVADLRPGDRIDATLEWRDDTPVFADLSVAARTRIEFADGVTGLFEAALETWQQARAEGVAVNSDVTYSTDGDANGALYTFAEQGGARDIFDEIRSGVLPLEPLVERLAEQGESEPHEIFVMRPADHPFVLVYIVFDRDSVLADTVRDTYDLPREDSATHDDSVNPDSPAASDDSA